MADSKLSGDRLPQFFAIRFEGLKPAFFQVLNGTAEAVPYPKTCVNQSSSAACEALPYPNPIDEARI